MQNVTIHFVRVLLFVVAFCCNKLVVAQSTTEYSFEFFNSAHGLPSSDIVSLAKDSKGFLWIGSSAGISRYDGYQFHNYNRSKEGDILGNANVLVFDSNDNLWIGTNTGLFCKTGNEILRISASSDLPQGVNDIFLDSDGTALLATENGPVKIIVKKPQNGHAEKIQLPDHVLPEWSSISKMQAARRIDHIRKAKDGTLYMADLQNLYVLRENKVELLHTIGNARDPILTLFPVDKSKIFFNTGKTEIHKVENGVHVNIQHKELYKPGAHDESSGEWHAGTFGLYYFHPPIATASRFINTMEHVPAPNGMLKDNNFFWLASNTGLVKIKPTLFIQYDVESIFPSHQDYYSFLHLKNGTLLLGSNRGSLLQKKGSKFDLFNRNIFPLAEIKCLYEDKEGRLWMGSGYQGLALISNGQVKRFTVENGLHDNSFNQFLETSNGRLFAIGDHGISEILINDQDLSVSFRKYYYESKLSRHAEFHSGIETPDGNILVGGEEGLFHLKSDSLYPLFIDGKVMTAKSIIRDKNNLVWIGTDGEGILQCVFNNNKLEVLRRFTEADGLNTSHYMNLLADYENNIWAASPKGLTFIGQGRYKDNVLNFDHSDGFIKPGYNSITLYQDRDSMIWAGTTFGFTSFKPGPNFLSAVPPAIYISGIRQIKANELIADSGENVFNYGDNSFNFSFAALDYENQQNIQYFYKLDGQDTNWINAGGLRNVTYENLSPGHYTFRAKALNNKGKWSMKDATYSFRISQPFWKQVWFIITSSVVVIGLLFLIIKFRDGQRAKIQRAEQQAMEKEMEVLRLNKDFATSQLTALRMQMNPHFIFNALNSIQHHILQGNVVEANKYLSKFSKLQRDILHCSSQQFISLEKELEILTAYLQLEQYRFGGNFSWKINMTEEIEPEEIFVPPMILQPFVENSIWHGLMPVQSERKLSIYFELESEDILLVSVRDNGIGRAASVLLKGNVSLNGEHESKGMLMVKERLQLLQQQYDKPFEVSINDITCAKGDVVGTNVELKFFIGNKRS